MRENGGLVAAFIFGLIVVSAFLGFALRVPQPSRHYSEIGGSATTPLTANSSDNRQILYRPCTGTPRDRNSDLCAQWEAAEAARDAALWAMIGTLVAAFGTLGLYIQISLTRRAVEDTGQATDAMRVANEIAQDAAYRDLRAYISFEEVQVFDASTTEFRGFIRIKNTGNTPSEYRIYLTSWIAPFPLDASAQKAAPNPPEYGRHKKFINRHGEEKIEWQYPDQYVRQSPELIITLLSQPDQYAIYLYGRLEFIDYRDRHRNLYFAFRSQETITPNRPFEMISCQYGGGYEYMGQPPPQRYYKA